MTKTKKDWDRIPKFLPVGYVTYPDEQIHECEALKIENSTREGDTIYIFVDELSKKYNIRIGLEFIQANYCPCCGAKL